MMFERYKMSFNWASATDPMAERDTGSGLPEPDLPFDQKLRRQLLGPEREDQELRRQLLGPELDEIAPAHDPKPEPEPEPRPAETRPATGRELYPLGSWQILQQPRRAQQAAAQKIRHQAPEEIRRATDALRTQLLQTLKAKGWRRVAVSAPSSGCGTTFTALNLALSMAAIPDVKTVLLDLNQRQPGAAKALGVTAMQSIADLLQGKVSFMDHLQRYGENLAIGLNSDIPPNPAEILQSGAAAEALDDMSAFLAPDVLLCDMPPLLEYDDLPAFLPQVDGVLIVADATKTTGQQITQCQKLLDGKAPFLGVVLNRGRARKAKA